MLRFVFDRPSIPLAALAPLRMTPTFYPSTALAVRDFDKLSVRMTATYCEITICEKLDIGMVSCETKGATKVNGYETVTLA